jgi:hypothetical protein
MGEGLDIIGKVIGTGQLAIRVVFSGSFIGNSHVCIVPEFLNTPAYIAEKISGGRKGVRKGMEAYGGACV